MTTTRWDRYTDFMQARAAAKIATVDDARRLAQRRVPLAVFDYIDGGAGSESTLRANRSSIEAVQFLPRMGVTKGWPAPELTTTVLGTEVAMPILLSPIGFTRMMDPLGDVAGARAAAKAGTIFTVSSMSGHTMAEVVAAATQPPPWFQLYFLGGRAGAEQLVANAQKAGFGALAVTLDTQFPGNRERDQRIGLHPPLKLDRRTMRIMAPQVAVRPRWLADVAHDRFQLTLVNAASLGTPEEPMSAADALFHWIATPPTWEDFKWLRELWQGPILAKGIVTGDDARRALDHGADAIVVSNHGGRQLDSVPAGLPALVEVVDAVGPDVEVLVDGGFRRGADVVKAIAAGARAAMVGRAWAYGLAAAGQPGVDRILAILREDLDRTLRLLGCASVADLNRSHVRIPKDW